MKREQRYGIKSLTKDFPTDEKCLTFLFEAQHSRECSCGGRYSLKTGRKQFQCSKCRFQIAPLSKTIFEKSKTPLFKWFLAIILVSEGISITGIQKEIGVTWKCAWRIHKIVANKIQSDIMMVWNVTNAKNKKKIRSFISTEGNKEIPAKNVQRK